jgi:RimJ/RimL family protein N-acetyltransferase
VKFERSRDYAAIRELFRRPPASLDAAERAGVEMIIAREAERSIAVFRLIPHGRTGELHLAFDRSVWGETAPILRAFVEWAWRETPHTRLIGPVLPSNRLAARLARAAGFVERGSIHGHLLFEIEKS